jgi:hypothetical protein
VPIASSVFGALVFFFLMIYPLINRPYFNASGNAISSACFSVGFVTFLFSIILSLIKKSFIIFDELPTDLKSINSLPIPLFAIILIWVAYAGLAVAAPILMFKITYKLSQKEWAMQPDDPIPILRTQHKKKVSLSSTFSSNNNSKSMSSLLNSSPSLVRAEGKSYPPSPSPLSISNKSELTQNLMGTPSSSLSIISTGLFIYLFCIIFYLGNNFDTPTASLVSLSDYDFTKIKSPLNNSSNDKKSKSYLSGPKFVPKLSSPKVGIHAVRFISNKILSANQGLPLLQLLLFCIVYDMM